MSFVPLTLEAANLYCGNTDSSNSLHLKLEGVKLPHFEEFYVDHRPGGAPVSIEIDMVFNRLQCDFSILGYDDSVYKTIRAWSNDQNWFLFYGLLRDQLTGGYLKVKAEIQGRLGKAEPEGWERGRLFTTSGSIRAIKAYQLYVGDVLVYDWKFDSNSFLIGALMPNQVPGVSGTTVPTTSAITVPITPGPAPATSPTLIVV